jgi:hypothetical protein
MIVPIEPSSSTYRILMTVSIWPSSSNRRNSTAPIPVPITPPAIITAPICRSTPPRRLCAKTPETLAPVTWLAAEAAATVGGTP